MLKIRMACNIFFIRDASSKLISLNQFFMKGIPLISYKIY